MAIFDFLKTKKEDINLKINSKVFYKIEQMKYKKDGINHVISYKKFAWSNKIQTIDIV